MLCVCVCGGVLPFSSLKHIALHAPESHCCCSLWASARSSTMVPSCSSHCLCISILLDSDASNSSLLCDRASLRCPSSLSPAVCIQHSYSPLFTLFRRHSGLTFVYIRCCCSSDREAWMSSGVRLSSCASLSLSALNNTTSAWRLLIKLQHKQEIMERNTSILLV